MRKAFEKEKTCEICTKTYTVYRRDFAENQRFCSNDCSGLFRRIPIEERFWKKVKKGKINDCWEWVGSKYPSGYGSIRYKKKVEGAHRVSWELKNGPITNGLWVLHKCDNRPCVNPNHLFLGTCRDNVDDMVKKGRNHIPYMRGEKNGMSKLTAEKVLRIRELFLLGATRREITEQYDLTYEHICSIIRGDKWSHI